MTELPIARIDDTSAWTVADVADSSQWSLTLEPTHLAELDGALASLRKRGIDRLGFAREDFPLAELGPWLDDVGTRLQHGLGFSRIRGLDPARYALDDLKRVYWGVGTYLGLGVYQNTQGDLIGHVTDHGHTFEGDDPYLSGIRGYTTRVALPPHTDSCDVVGLLCIKKARSGGESSVVSAMALYNELAATRPDLLTPLIDGFHLDLVGKGTADDQISFSRVPVFSFFGGKLSCRFNKRQIELGAEKAGHPLTAVQQQSVDAVRALSLDPKFKLEMALEPGDMQFLNSHTTLHAREAFEDFTDPAERRLMLRLWLSVPEGRPIAPALAAQLNTAARSGVRKRG